MHDHTISVIIPTACRADSALLLNRAIDSIVSQSGVVVNLIVVVNGNCYDEELLRLLEKDARLQLVKIEDANVSRARYKGVSQVTDDYFCFLDDDDEFLPRALKKRAEILSSHNHVDIVVTNGYEYRLEGETPLVPPGAAEKIMERSDLYFFSKNWFASPAALFRTKSVDREIFDFSFKYFEWTYLLFLSLSKGLKFYYDEALTYRKYEDNPSSISKSVEYAMAFPGFLLVLETLSLKADIKRQIQKRYVVTLNALSNMELGLGHRGRAWVSHVKCMLAGGWRFLPYTRHLLSFRRSPSLPAANSNGRATDTASR